MFELHQRVKLNPGVFGTIIGGPVTIHHNKGNDPSICYAVLLDNGFYSADGDTYISTMLINEDCISSELQ